MFVRMTKQSKQKVLIICLLAIALFITASACSKTVSTNKKQPTKPANQDTTGVLMLGRSVMGGWFSHWNAENNKVTEDGFTLYYDELQSPPDIVDSAKTKIEDSGLDVTIVFFKLCFVDFSGGSREEARDKLNENKRYVQDMYNIVVKDKGLTLIIGNALPQVKKDTTEDLVWSHREFNKFLKDFAAEHPGQVYMFDEYGILSDEGGALKAEYASDGEDSHPNDAGYSAMDGPFLDLLESLK